MASQTRRLPGFSSAHFIDNPASARVLAKLGFEPVGRGTIVCAARGHDVEAVTYWLDRKRAALAIPHAGRREPSRAAALAHLARPAQARPEACATP